MTPEPAGLVLKSQATVATTPPALTGRTILVSVASRVEAYMQIQFSSVMVEDQE